MWILITITLCSPLKRDAFSHYVLPSHTYISYALVLILWLNDRKEAGFVLAGMVKVLVNEGCNTSVEDAYRNNALCNTATDDICLTLRSSDSLYQHPACRTVFIDNQLAEQSLSTISLQNSLYQQSACRTVFINNQLAEQLLLIVCMQTVLGIYTSKCPIT